MRLNLFFIIFIAVLFFSCASGPVDIPEDATPSKIIQKAQEATDQNKYKMAIEYYQVLLERYGSIGEYYCIGNYEIAFIHYKQKRYTEARQGFEYLLSLYDTSRGSTLPPRFKVLAERILKRMTERGH